MAHFRFYRRERIFPGLAINMSRSGPSMTVGVRGLHWTFGRTGVTRTVGIPGSGMYWTSKSGRHTGVHSSHVERLAPSQWHTLAHAAVAVLLAFLLVFVMVPAVLLAGFAHASQRGHGRRSR